VGADGATGFVAPNPAPPVIASSCESRGSASMCAPSSGFSSSFRSFRSYLREMTSLMSTQRVETSPPARSNRQRSKEPPGETAKFHLSRATHRRSDSVFADLVTLASEMRSPLCCRVVEALSLPRPPTCRLRCRGGGMANIRGPKNEQDGESLDGLNEGLLGTPGRAIRGCPGPPFAAFEPYPFRDSRYHPIMSAEESPLAAGARSIPTSADAWSHATIRRTHLSSIYAD